MLQYNPTVSGSLQVTGTITATQGITGSFSGSVAGFPTDVSAFSASLSTRITATESTSSEYVTTSSSLASRVSLTEVTSSQYVTASGSLAARLTSNEARTGSFATTGSNQFNGNQTVTGSLTATGTIVAQTLVVQTITSSVDFVSGSTRFGSTTGNTHEFTGSVLVSGSVGIGTSAPSVALDIIGASNAASRGRYAKTGEGILQLGANRSTSNVPYIGSENAYDFAFITNDTERMRIASGSGNVGIGTTTPTSTLDILASSAGSTSNILRLKNLSNDASTGLRMRWDFASLAGAYLDVTTDSSGHKSMTLYLSAANATPVEVFNLAGSNKAATFAGSITATQGIFSENSGNVILQALKTGATNATTALIRQTGAGGNGNQDIGLVVDIQGANDADRIANFRYYDGSTYTSRMTITRGGGVGIGTTDPSYKLDVRSDVNGDTVLARFQNRDGNLSTGAYIGFSTGYAAIATIGAKREGAENDSSLVFSPMLNENAVERMRITSGGNVGIGTTTPGASLHVVGNSSQSAIISTAHASVFYTTYRYNTSVDVGYIGNGSGVASGGSASDFGIQALGNFVVTAGGSAERMRITSGGDVGIGTTSPLQTSSNRIVTTINGTTSAVLNLSTGGTLRSYLYADSGGSTFETVGTNTIAANSTNIISFTTNGTERMKIMSGGAIGTGQANSTSLRATLVKRGTTSVTFNMSLNTIGAWRPGFATVRVSGAQNGLQEAYAAWYIVRITGYFGAGTAINVLSSGGDTGSVSISSSSDQNSPQAFSITVTDGGATTDTMIADIDVAYHEGIISLT